MNVLPADPAASLSAPPVEPSSLDEAGPLQLVRSVSRRYLLVLATVAALVVIDQAIIQPQLVRLNFYAPAINVAGRQRMLSQSITKQALALVLPNQGNGGDQKARREQLARSIREWSEAHQGLLQGSRTLGLQPLGDASIVAVLRAVEPQMQAIQTSATRLAAQDAGSDESRSRALAAILAKEPLYLEGMERAVKLLEASAGRRVELLRWCGLGVMLLVLGLLVGMYFLVVRPAVGVIRTQIGTLADSELRHRVLAALLGKARDELEARVDERTSELLATNRALGQQIAEREAAEKRTSELSTALAHASRVTALGQLATGLAHEINQPLASIANYADVLELALEAGTADADQTSQTVGKLKQAALRAGQIVRRMRNFMRPANGQGTPLELNELVRDVCDLCRPQLKQSDVRLSLDLTAEPACVVAEALEIQQVLVNLVQNAIQALGECPPRQREIHIRTYVAAESVNLEVTDTGPGFPCQAVEDAFAPFFSTKVDGLGMGLDISRTIVERHQGRLWGRNRDCGGAVVGICLPLIVLHESSTSTADCLCR